MIETDKIRKLAIEAVLSGQPMKEVAADRGVAYSTLARWVMNAKHGEPANQVNSEVNTEVSLPLPNVMYTIPDEIEELENGVDKRDVSTETGNIKDQPTPKIEDTIALFHRKLHKLIEGNLQANYVGSIGNALKALKEMGNVTDAKNDIETLLTMLNEIEGEETDET